MAVQSARSGHGHNIIMEPASCGGRGPGMRVQRRPVVSISSRCSCAKHGANKSSTDRPDGGEQSRRVPVLPKKAATRSRPGRGRAGQRSAARRRAIPSDSYPDSPSGADRSARAEAAERAAADDNRSLTSLVEKLLIDHLRTTETRDREPRRRHKR
jgi:hypothetical protein